jgi:hypothetical protein
MNSTGHWRPQMPVYYGRDQTDQLERIKADGTKRQTRLHPVTLLLPSQSLFKHPTASTKNIFTVTLQTPYCIYQEHLHSHSSNTLLHLPRTSSQSLFKHPTASTKNIVTVTLHTPYCIYQEHLPLYSQQPPPSLIYTHTCTCTDT